MGEKRGSEKRLGKRAAAKKGAAEKRAEKGGDGESAVLGVIAGMEGLDRELGERVHGIVMGSGLGFEPRLWYGMPAYARGGKVVVFFQSAGKFKTRYATLGFMHEAKLDEGEMWPVAFALKGVGEVEERRIRELVRRATGEA